jgi:peptidyl-dipeptidase A
MAGRDPPTAPDRPSPGRFVMTPRPAAAFSSLSFAFGLAVVFPLMSQIIRADEPDNDSVARSFVAKHEIRIHPLERAANLAWWNANISGKNEDFQAKEDAQNRLDLALSNHNAFAALKALKGGTISDPILAREVAVLYLMYLEKQVEPSLLRQITAKANAVEKTFNTYRAKVKGKEMTDSEVRKVLKESKDSAQRQAVWEASKEVGPLVEANLKELAKLRNEAARQLGFPNFHAMQFVLNEQTSEGVEKLFDDLDALTREPFRAAKTEIDGKLAAKYGISIEQLRPWHYHDPFFQEAPAVSAVDLDAPYAKADILKLCRDFYTGIGLPIDDVLAHSDLDEKPGKSPHAFCIDIDREGDVRVLGNVVPNEYWAETMLHELGHAVYSSKNIPSSMPYVLRTEAHILTTEGVAKMFERFAKDADWLTAMGVKLADAKGFDEAGSTARRHSLLIFSRWCQVMLRFEKALYEDPDRDLNATWWELVEKYQFLKRPKDRNAPDYASKIHIVSAPAYYHNYLMGELFAAQVHAAICRDALNGADPSKASYVGKPEVGTYLKTKVFAPGRSLSWNELTKHATGADLNPSAFAAEFQEK